MCGWKTTLPFFLLVMMKYYLWLCLKTTIIMYYIKCGMGGGGGVTPPLFRIHDEVLSVTLSQMAMVVCVGVENYLTSFPP